MRLFDKYCNTAREFDWVFDARFTTDGVLVTAGRENLQDGYPYLLSGRIVGNTMKDGRIFNDYGDGPEEFKAGFRYHLAVMANVDYPLRYKTWLDMFLATDPVNRSEKFLAAETGYSERQLRRARMCGYGDGYLMDVLCSKVLWLHPSEVFGQAAWLESTALDPKETLDKTPAVA